ncbi:hypothetical protein STEG23_006555, partial [Scotinomys teguina]
ERKTSVFTQCGVQDTKCFTDALYTGHLSMFVTNIACPTNVIRRWNNGLVAKSMYYSSKGYEFDS